MFILIFLQFPTISKKFWSGCNNPFFGGKGGGGQNLKYKIANVVFILLFMQFTHSFSNKKNLFLGHIQKDGRKEGGGGQILKIEKF